MAVDWSVAAAWWGAGLSTLLAIRVVLRERARVQVRETDNAIVAPEQPGAAATRECTIRITNLTRTPITVRRIVLLTGGEFGYFDPEWIMTTATRPQFTLDAHGDEALIRIDRKNPVLPQERIRIAVQDTYDRWWPLRRRPQVFLGRLRTDHRAHKRWRTVARVRLRRLRER